MYKKIIINLFVFALIIANSISTINSNILKQKNYVESIDEKMLELGYIREILHYNAKGELHYEKNNNDILIRYSINEMKYISLSINVLNEQSLSEVMRLIKIVYDDETCLNWIFDNLVLNMQQLVLTNQEQDSNFLTEDFYYVTRVDFNDEDGIEAYVSVSLFTK